MKKNGEWKSYDYLPFEMLRKQWQTVKEIGYGLNQAGINCYADDQYPKEQKWEKGGTSFTLKATDFQKAVKQ